MTNDEREQRYAKEIALACGYVDPLRQHQISARAAVAVADAEQADLRAEVERHRVAARDFARMLDAAHGRVALAHLGRN
jgi:hypothetical protein